MLAVSPRAKDSGSSICRVMIRRDSQDYKFQLAPLGYTEETHRKVTENKWKK